jgi:hypothetical protein
VVLAPAREDCQAAMMAVVAKSTTGLSGAECQSLTRLSGSSGVTVSQGNLGHLGRLGSHGSVPAHKSQPSRRGATRSMQVASVFDPGHPPCGPWAPVAGRRDGGEGE